jgi:hypothetical protein
MKELTPGVVLGARFVLVRRLGRGGTAEVWLAGDRERGEQVALKLLDSEKEMDAEKGTHTFSEEKGVCVPFSASFSALAEDIARSRALPREFAVAVHDVLQLEGRTIVVMEFLPGGDLGQFRGRSYESWTQAADDVAAALAASHAAGLVHRDLKCSNVLLDGEGRARLSDFGMAAPAGSRAPGGGSPYNASPQQLRGEPAQPADDLYAFGALLYELIAGHPPYYPDITRDRVLHEPVPPLVPRGAVPVGVRELALRLLAKSPQERPASATAARTRLAAVAADAADLVEPLAHALPAGSPRAMSRRSHWLPATIVAAGLAVLAAMIWLPQQFTARNPDVAKEARVQAERSRETRRAREERLAQQAAARAAAEAARDQFDAAFKALDARAAARWATAAFAEARDGGAHAAQRHAVEDYAAAKQAWEKAAARLAELERQVPQALKNALQGGRAALASADTVAAREAFGLALAIEPGNAEASAGIARARRLEQAFTIVDAAVADERAGRLASAEQRFRQALAIDAAAPGVREGIDRLAARRTGDAFAAAMSRGLADLAAGRSEAARSAFTQALAFRPGSQEARDAMAAVDQGQRAAALRLLEVRARTAESGERWDEALSAWREAAALEQSLESAREGIARATPRAELQRRIDTLIREPERLWDAEGRAEARNLAARAAASGNPRLRLAAAARELERLAAAAQSPVRLRLESDGVTQVAIYRVGQYGAFSQRDVELLPGKYTVVGTRSGFRDVRREVVLPPGAAATAVVVRCEEPI